MHWPEDNRDWDLSERDGPSGRVPNRHKSTYRDVNELKPDPRAGIHHDDRGMAMLGQAAS